MLFESLIISNEEKRGLMEVEFSGDLGLLIKDVAQTIENETKSIRCQVRVWLEKAMVFFNPDLSFN